ncbi:hypothetical protein, partial [Paraburkholderia ginsengiterrae]|uniref:hypothetical protein n=1 Tax=Paraburkholderia ginsengiterrae TaxID=1462993 RepID=UPI0012FA1453
MHRSEDGPNNGADRMALWVLGGGQGTMDVKGRASWDANCDRGGAAGKGKLPGAVVLDVAAAPTLNNT